MRWGIEESSLFEEEESSRCISGGMEREELEWDDVFELQINFAREEEDADDMPMENASSLESS